MKFGHRGFTLMELLVTIAILTVVMALLIFPIFSAYGYIQKAQARTEAHRAGDEAVQQLKQELESAAYIFEIPDDGSFLTVVTGDDEGKYIDTENGSVHVLRFTKILDDPCNDQYAPFWNPSDANNPYVLGRYAHKESWHRAVAYAADFGYPRYGLNMALPSDVLKQQYRNAIHSLTPLGKRWDVPSFMITPLRVVSESIPIQKDARGKLDPTVVVARYPLWAGRNQDSDAIDDTQLAAMYGGLSLNWVKSEMLAWYGTDVATVTSGVTNGKTITVDDSADLWPEMTIDIVASDRSSSQTRTIAQVDKTANTVTFYDNVIISDNSIIRSKRMYMLGKNPFGYQILVINSAGDRSYGIDPGTKVMAYSRHFMDWPPIDRPDWDWAKPLWTRGEVERQRLEGRLVFAQPVAPETLTFSSYAKGTSYTLPTPTDLAPTGWTASQWDGNLTYLVRAPKAITLKDAAGTVTKVFHLVDKDPSDLKTEEYCLLHKGVLDGSSREIAFGDDMVDGAWTVVYPAASSGKQALYTICDLQPSDTVVGTYSTKGVLDIALTVSRQDSAGKTPAQTRQDYTAHLRFTARNAIAHARSSR